MPHYAHTLEGRPQSEWEWMADHEQNVATLCREFLSRIHPDLAPWGEILGHWHDLGKYSDSFQAYLTQAGGIPRLLPTATTASNETIDEKVGAAVRVAFPVRLLISILVGTDDLDAKAAPSKSLGAAGGLIL